MSECVKVVVRCRPLNDREIASKTATVLSVDPNDRQCILREPGDTVARLCKTFTFDSVYDTDSTNEDIYPDAVAPLVDGILQGYNGCVFAYGQTSCGKTFSMQGLQHPEPQKGVMSRAFEQIFQNIQTTDVSYYLVKASYLEIYNEEIRDLLTKETYEKLEIKEHPEKGIYVKGISEVEVTNVEDMEEVLEVGGWNRALGATELNPDSSRSHSIFVVDFELCYTSEDDGKEVFRSGRLNLVDLAGSERQQKAKAGGERFREATKINLSLSALGNVISALVNPKARHIPYRASKLTRFLQESLGGNSRTLMIACVSPGENNYYETLSTLRYANRAKNIKNRPRINEDPKDALIRQYQKEVKMLRQFLSQQIKMPANHELPMIPHSTLSSDNETVITSDKPPVRSAVVISKQAQLEYERRITELQHRYDYEHVSKERLSAAHQTLKEDYENYRLKSEYSLQKLSVENRLKIEELQQQIDHQVSIDSTCEEHPRKLIKPNCDWKVEKPSGCISNSDEVLSTESWSPRRNAHLWSCHWLKCYCDNNTTTTGSTVPLDGQLADEQDSGHESGIDTNEVDERLCSDLDSPTDDGKAISTQPNLSNTSHENIEKCRISRSKSERSVLDFCCLAPCVSLFGENMIRLVHLYTALSIESRESQTEEERE